MAPGFARQGGKLPDGGGQWPEAPTKAMSQCVAGRLHFRRASRRKIFGFFQLKLKSFDHEVWKIWNILKNDLKNLPFLTKILILYWRTSTFYLQNRAYYRDNWGLLRFKYATLRIKVPDEIGNFPRRGGESPLAPSWRHPCK